MSDAKPEYAVPAEIAGRPAWHRLEDQRTYYSRRAGEYQDRYKHIKLALIALSAMIPILVFLPLPEVTKYVVALAGVAIAMLEGLLLLNQYGPLWVKYRSTAEGLKRERWLLLAGAGDYKELSTDAAMRLLAERVEALLEEEHRDWTDQQKKVLEALANTQAWVKGQMDETRRLAAGGAAAPVAPAPALPTQTAPAAAAAEAETPPPADDGTPSESAVPPAR